MQAIAPGKSIEPHEGHGWPEAPGAGIVGNVIEGEGLGVRPLPTPAATGTGVAAGTPNGFWQTGQRTVLPAALSGTCIERWQCGQRITCGMERSLASSLALGPLAEAQHAAADADQVARLEGHAADHGLIVDKGAGRRFFVLYIIPIARQQDTGVQLFDLVVAEQANVARLGPADGRPFAGQDQFAAS